ncbi:hypothetical protein F511_16092 [Dorcoceras hygrometricum]|uniref:Uncharacterized protein n=1 Tax=Dorcoceras hygrometricum TaxID=472368 RepID=A0A2Z7BTV4_9LAMI|nr:hypothetical protein F511_16092 [Dorcoceras hygrometricum]
MQEGQRVQAQECATCTHGYRPARATPDEACVRDRRATPADTCAHSLRPPERYASRFARGTSVHGMRDGRASCGEMAPGSNQFHEGIGTSTVERLDRRLIRSKTRISTPSPVCTRKPMTISRNGISSPRWSEQIPTTVAGSDGGGDGDGRRERNAVVEVLVGFGVARGNAMSYRVFKFDTKPYFRRLPSFTPPFGARLVVRSSSSLERLIDTIVETGVAGIEEHEVVAVLVCLRDC